MGINVDDSKDLLGQVEDLRSRLEEAEETLAAIRRGEVDALVVHEPGGERVYTFQGADQAYRLLIEQMNEGAATLSGEGRILYGNRRLGEMLKEPLGRVIGSPLVSFVDEQDRETLGILLEAGWRESIQGDLLLRAGDGTSIPVQLSLTPLRFEGFSGISAIVTDLTIRKQAEVADTRLAAIVQASDDAIISKSPDGTILTWNPGAERMYGYSEAEAVGQSISILIPQDLPSEFRDIMRRLRRGERIERYETRRQGKNGQSLHVSMSIAPLKDPAGRVVGAAAIARDITEREQMEMALRRRGEELAAANSELAAAARLKDEFLASMSHELRTPLNGILGMSEGLQEQVYGPLNPKQLRAVRDVEECGRHLLALINDILDVAKIEAGKVELELAPVTVEVVCQASLRLVKESALKKKITVSLHLDKQVRILTADERRLKQVLVNLLSNAVKFTDEGGQVGLDVVGEGDKRQVWFTVWDTGIGMRPDELQRLFQPFVQLDSRLSRQYEGTGLGLALVKRLTELHGGRVLVESQPGKGSRFTVVLPWTTKLAVPVASNSREGHQEQTSLLENAPEALEGPLILAVDDNPRNARGMVDYLIFKGFRVVSVASGAEAIEVAKKLYPRLILMDLQMREMDGLEAIRRIRLLSGLREVPIVAITALAMAGDRERFLEAGATEYVSKPLSLDKFRQTIESLLNR